MAKLTMTESQAVAQISKLLYDFLPGTFAGTTWPTVASQFGLQEYWQQGSKLPAITHLLESTLQFHRGMFCDFLIAVVQAGMAYRIRKDNPVKRHEIIELNRLLLSVEFKIPELNVASFLSNLPEDDPDQVEAPPASKVVSKGDIERLHQQFLGLFQEANAQRRGYLFEGFLNDLFHIHNLAPRGSFKVAGEQIDGSFEWKGITYLVEARWRANPSNTSDLLVLRGKAEKSDWTRGLFISINGFSPLASDTHMIGRKANLICMSGEDLILILEKHWSLEDALKAKLRHTGETAEVYVPISQLR